MYKLGTLVEKLIEIVPEGMVLFFSSVSLMRKCEQIWKSEEIFEKIDLKKRIFIEGKSD